MISSDLLRAKVARYGQEFHRWPRLWRWYVGMACRMNAETQQHFQALLQEECRYSAVLRELNDITPSEALQKRLAAISERPRPQPISARQTPLWRLSMSTALASVMLGFALGAGGILVPDDSLAESYLDNSATVYEVSSWLAGEEE